MSETIFRVLLSELKSLRVRCSHPKCGVVMEFPLRRMADEAGELRCPSCSSQLQERGEGKRRLMALADAVLALQRDQAVAVEFLIPVPAPKPD